MDGVVSLERCRELYYSYIFPCKVLSNTIKIITSVDSDH